MGDQPGCPCSICEADFKVAAPSLKSGQPISSLRDRINSVLARHYPQTTGYHDELTDWCQCGLRRDHVADAVIAALGEIPARSFTDDHGRTWEWCGGKPGTWAWRVTALPIPDEKGWGCGQIGCKACY